MSLRFVGQWFYVFSIYKTKNFYMKEIKNYYTAAQPTKLVQATVDGVLEAYGDSN